MGSSAHVASTASVCVRSCSLPGPAPPYRHRRPSGRRADVTRRTPRRRQEPCVQVNHNLDVAHGLRRRDLEDASGKERKGRRERRRETERERGGRRDQYGELVKSNAPALRPPVRELARRRCVRRFNIDTVDNAPLFFLSFPTFLFLPISSSSFFLISRKLAERTQSHARARARRRPK